MMKLYEQLETTGFIVVHALIALTIARIVLTVIKAIAVPPIRPEEQKNKEKDNIKVDEELEKYFNYEENKDV